ncbi:MAG TPA: HAD-IC family P-type ATPase [Microbacteriaceae bacterium]|nr:HAD-IC family P-type ATPase [Microbacteriaceae bacterium]
MSATSTRTTEPSGLTAAEVAERVADGGINAFDQASSRSAWNIIRANVFTLFNAIVVGCFLVLFVLGRWQDALFGFSAVANSIIGSVQEFRAKRSLDRLALLSAPLARVRRDGADVEIAPREVVLDDLLVLRAGDQVPADAVVVASRGLQLDESMLTGESDAIDKSAGAEVLSGSIVVGGEGLARTTRVGADSFANRFADEAKRFSLMASELRASLDRVLLWITWLVGPISLLVLNAQMIALGGWAEAIESGAWRDAAVSTIAAVIAMIPLGLVLMTSLAFAVGAVKLSTRKVLVNELPAVEGLARVDIICLDKTGTLTEGDIAFDGAHPFDDAEPTKGAALPWHAALAWWGDQADANATSRSLAGRFGEAPVARPVARIAFSSARKWSAVAFSSGPAGSWVLGAPEMVFPAGHGALMERVASFADTGRRTLVLASVAAAFDEEAAEAELLPEGLEPVALLTFAEQIRPDAAETLGYFAEQGVDVRIISGDSPRTVAAIARRLGLPAGEGFDARDLPEDSAGIAEVLEREIVFGRVTPQQKKAIVVALQSKGRTVAMTGDGVNDALAIKQADIGIAMESGSPATKAVARLVLLDGRFSHLPGVVAEGRQVIANIERVSMLFLTKTSYAVLLAVLFGAALMVFPFLPRQMSIIDGLTIGIPAFFLALLPNTPRYTPGFLRRSLAFALPTGAIVAVALLAFAAAATSLGIETKPLRTGATLVLAILGLWILGVLSRPIGLVKGAVIGAMMIGLVLVFTIPFAGGFLEFVDPGPDGALLVALICAIGIGLIELVRLAHRRLIGRAWFRKPLRLRRGEGTA